MEQQIILTVTTFYILLKLKQFMNLKCTYVLQVTLHNNFCRYVVINELYRISMIIFEIYMMSQKIGFLVSHSFVLFAVRKHGKVTTRKVNKY